MTGRNPVLPPLSALLFDKKSEMIESGLKINKPNVFFTANNHGMITLPPLSSGITRPSSVDSALRHTVTKKNDEKINCNDQHQNASSLRSQSSLSLYDDNYVAKTPVKKNTAPHSNKMATPYTPKTTDDHRREDSNKGKALSSTLTKKNNISMPLSAAKAIITPSANDKKKSFAFITHSQETFPTKEPKIDNAPLARRKRRRTSTQELTILQNEFAVCSTPDKQKRIELAGRCKMSEKAVQIWFQNRRQAVKRQRLAAEKSVAHSDADASSTDYESNENPIELSPSVKTATVKEDSTAAVTGSHNTPPRVEDLDRNAQHRQPTPTKKQPQALQKKGQALTFHLKTDKKILTLLKTSPNSRVNKLINGSENSDENRQQNLSTPCKKFKIENKKSDRAPLRDLNTNLIPSNV